MSGRLPFAPHEWIDRTAPLSFDFEGQRHSALRGDCVTSALWANGVRVVGRSFKYHRPRGILSLADHDVNAMFQWGPKLNLRGDVTPVEPEMKLTAVNSIGDLARDKGRALDKLSAFLPVGFYYKAFYRPKSLFPKWERMFRVLAGLGKVDFGTPRAQTPKRYLHTDLLVVGAGASGLSAAIAAAEAGARVVLAEENVRAGGSLGYQRGGKPDDTALIDQLLARAGSLPNLEFRLGACAAGYYADCWVPLVSASGITKLRSQAVVIATGAQEQPAVFRNNDLPGVMLASAAQRLIYRYRVKPANTALVLAANREGYEAALDLKASGVAVVALLDLRPEGEVSPVADAVDAAGIEIRKGCCVYEALGDHAGLRAALVCQHRADGEADISTARTIVCDGLFMSVGWAPAAALLYEAGASMRFDDELQQFVPERLPEGIFAAGRVNGVHEIAQKLADGRLAARAALAFLGRASPIEGVRPSPRGGGGPVIPIPSSRIPRARTSSISTKTCSSRISSMRPRRDSTTSSS